MNSYKALNKQVFKYGEYCIVPLRMDDRYDIMKWRNEQIYHLRQNELLTKEKQDAYFNNVISSLFDEDNPGQILFSYLNGGTCIGYGGLVHINWIDKNAEISFVMSTKLEKENFSNYWRIFLGLIEQLAFRELKLHKIFTNAFDIRPNLFDAIEKSGYIKEATLREHCFIEREYKDIIIHSKFNSFEAD